jgi:hypothetical protein
MSRQLSQSARDARLEAVQQRLTASVAALVTGEDWRRALEFAARFRARSFGNTMLIYLAHHEAFQAGKVPNPTPTYVAGFKQWQSLGRQVQKGQTGYAILAPNTARFATSTPAKAESWRRLGRGEKPRGGEVVRTKLIGLHPTYVWDVSQTDGRPLVEPPAPQLLRGQAPEGLWDGLADQITAQGFELRLVSDAKVIGGANGLTDFITRELSVRMDMDDAQQAKVLAHELGHVLLHAPEDLQARADATLHRGIAEVEAESVALMLLSAHGMDSSAYTVPYVSSWANSVPGKSPIEVVAATADRVRVTANAILDHLDTIQVGNGDPPGLTRDHGTPEPPRSTAGLPARRCEQIAGIGVTGS